MRGKGKDMVLILAVYQGLSLNMLSFSLQSSPPGRECGGWGGGLMSWARALASTLCCSIHESAVPPGTKPALIKTNSIAQCMENGPHYYYRLEVTFLWDHPIGGLVCDICIYSRSSLPS